MTEWLADDCVGRIVLSMKKNKERLVLVWYYADGTRKEYLADAHVERNHYTKMGWAVEIAAYELRTAEKNPSLDRVNFKYKGVW